MVKLDISLSLTHHQIIEQKYYKQLQVSSLF